MATAQPESSPLGSYELWADRSLKAPGALKQLGRLGPECQRVLAKSHSREVAK